MDIARRKPPLLARLGIYTLVIAGVGLAAAYYLGLFVPPEDNRLAVRNSEKVFERLTRDAEHGEFSAQRELGKIYDTGYSHIPANAEESIKWYTRAAEKGDMCALLNLGTKYMDGRNIPKDLGKARYWLEKAAALNDPYAAWYLALIHSGADGVDARQETARYWVQKSIDNGGYQYAWALGDLYYWYPESRDYPKALSYYQIAAEKGNNAYAMGKVGYMYEIGRGIDVDIEKAGHWIGKAAERDNDWAKKRREKHALDCRSQKFESCRFLAGAGNAEAQRLLALAYYQGQFGLPQSIENYMTWITQAAESGSPRAQITLADTYAGKVAGFAQTNPALAHAWYAVAAHYEVTPALKTKLQKQSADTLAALPQNAQAAAQALAQESIKKYQVQNDVTLR